MINFIACIIVSLALGASLMDDKFTISDVAAIMILTAALIGNIFIVVKRLNRE